MKVPPLLTRRCLAVLAAAIGLLATAAGQELSAPLVPGPPRLVITGMVKSGSTPLPGVNIAIGDPTGRQVVTSTDADGTFRAEIPGEGRWGIRAELAAFSPAVKEAVIETAHPAVHVELQMILLSRAVAAPPRAVTTPPARRAAVMGGARPGFQRLDVTEDLSTEAAPGNDTAALPGMPALALSADTATESIAVNGAMGSTQDYARNFSDLRDRIQEMRDTGQSPSGMPGFGGPFGGGGMGGRGGGGRGGSGGGRFDVNKVHGSLYDTIGNSALDASPYSLSGEPGKPLSGSNRFGATLGGPLRIPKVFDAGPKTSFFISLAGTRATTPYDAFSHVPTVAERNGDFSQTVYTSGPGAGQPVQVYNPATGLLFPSAIVPVSPAAAALLKYIPLPNQQGVENFRYSTAQGNDNFTLGARLIHNFGAARQNRRGLAGRSSNNVNFAINYSSTKADLVNPFPTLGGKTNSQGLNINAGHSLTHGHWTNQLRFTFNQQQTQQSNQFAGVTNVAAAAGIAGVSATPADWGVPGLSFSDLSSLANVTPQQRRDRVFQITDTGIWRHGKHTLRMGGDFRRMLTRLHNNTNPNGAFTFTGFATSLIGSNGKPVSGTGYDLADFLLGYPQQTSIQYSPYTFDFAAVGYDIFLQDSWRMRSNFSLELGLRYEYVSPYSESGDHIVNLDAAPGFTAVAAVQPGRTGPITGTTYPSSLVKPDRNNYAPRIGLAWKPAGNKLVVRAGYGVNYNLGQYKSIVQQLAFQPPFSVTQTNVAAAPTSLTLVNGFAANANVLTNSYGVDPNYRLGYVQMWNLNLQYELSPTLLLNVGYTGSKGTDLDLVEAPNRGPSGLLIANVQPFLWETSAGDSILHAGTLRLRKRMTHGMSVGGTYTYSKSIDNASSIGGTAVVVAQNPLNLAAERGLSSFDMRHQLKGDFLYELPLGTGKKWLDRGGTRARIFGDWTWSGTFTAQSGTPWTARLLGAYSDVSSGVNGALRADYNGQPIQLSNPSVSQWFNTAAFSAPAGQFGDAGRNTIIGPGLVDFDMAMSKNFPIRETMGLEARLSATNVFNTPHFTAIDTVVNSPTFGRVTSAGAMRTMKLALRFRF